MQPRKSPLADLCTLSALSFCLSSSFLPSFCVLGNVGILILRRAPPPTLLRRPWKKDDGPIHKDAASLSLSLSPPRQRQLPYIVDVSTTCFLDYTSKYKTIFFQEGVMSPTVATSQPAEHFQ